jgi:hypothetical protein
MQGMQLGSLWSPSFLHAAIMLLFFFFFFDSVFLQEPVINKVRMRL